MKLQKIISGGQTGADQGGLEAALHLGIKTGGYAPDKYETETGSNYQLKMKYKLIEAGSLVQRSKKNIDYSDGTVVFLLKESPGTTCSLNYALTKKWGMKPGNDKYKPVCVISKFDQENILKLQDFLKKNEIETLNIVGHRESGFKGIQKNVRDFLIKTLVEYFI